MTMTYDNDIKHGHINTDSGYTYGGYSASQTVHQRYRFSAFRFIGEINFKITVYFLYLFNLLDELSNLKF